MKIHIEVISNNCKTKEYIKGVSHKYGTYTKTRYISEAKSYQSPVYGGDQNTRKSHISLIPVD